MTKPVAVLTSLSTLFAVQLTLAPPAAADDHADTPPADDTSTPKPHARGDFDAGGQARFPSGPDEMGNFASFNFVAFDAKATYYLLPSVTLDGFFPLAVKHPDTIGGDPMAGGGIEPKMIGGARIGLDARIPKLPKLPGLRYETSLGLQLGLAYMREGALLLTPQDYPLFVGDFQPGATVGLLTRIKLSSVVDFNLDPVVVMQKGAAENLTAIQIPLALVLQAGSVVKLGANLAINTGDDFKFGGDSGGRISTGAMLELKVGKILIHTGAGLASLLTGGLYPSISDSVYIDVNAKYVK